MLEEIELINFRCFDHCIIEFDKFNVLVGKNNTGKSTVVDALKLISNVVRYASYRTHYLEDRDIPFSLTNLRHDYREADTTIHAKFTQGYEVSIVFPIDATPYADFVHDGESISSREDLRPLTQQNIGIIPPVGTFEITENPGSRKYLLSVIVSHLTPRHFRNIWYYFDEDFEDFRRAIEKTWVGCTIQPPEFIPSQNELYMFFIENGITREIFWSGHGFQVWLQLMTFLVKLGHIDSLVLDEPDIYLHSDMQKKLVRICRDRANQIIIATHAVDIIEEVEPEDILCIDKNLNNVKRLSSIDEVQTIVTELGSAQNLKLVHFYRGRTCLFVEGKDFDYLKILAKTLNIEEFVREEGFTVVPLEGFSNWDRLIHINWITKNAFGEDVRCYVILDSDYHTKQEKKDILRIFQQKGIKAHIWAKKEIENYLINYNSLYRMFTTKYHERHGKAKLPLSASDFTKKVQSFFDESKNHVISQLAASEIQNRPPESALPSTIISKTMVEFEKNWGDMEFRKNIIPGKDFFSKLNTWLNSEYKIRISIRYALHSLLSDEIEPEIIDVINSILELTHSRD